MGIKRRDNSANQVGTLSATVLSGAGIRLARREVYTVGFLVRDLVFDHVEIVVQWHGVVHVPVHDAEGGHAKSDAKVQETNCCHQ
jgi:hypothetical protein